MLVPSAALQPHYRTLQGGSLSAPRRPGEAILGPTAAAPRNQHRGLTMLAPLAALALRSRSLPGDPRSAPRRPGWAIPGLFGRPHGTNIVVCLCWFRGLLSRCGGNMRRRPALITCVGVSGSLSPPGPRGSDGAFLATWGHYHWMGSPPWWPYGPMPIPMPIPMHIFRRCPQRNPPLNP